MSAKPKINIIVLILLLILPVLPGCRDRDKIEPLRAYMNAAHDLWGFNGAVLVGSGNKMILAEGYGQANFNTDEPITKDTKFFISSLTKQFTAAAILQLQERGLLDINDPIIDYLPQYPEKQGSKITIHHLLTHSSGLVDYLSDPFIIINRTQSFSPSKLMDFFINKDLLFPPGSTFYYSNSNYVVLGAIIEAVAKQSYEAYLHHNIFKPLKMNTSGYARREAGLPSRATGYTITDKGKMVEALPVHFSVMHTAGALYTTINDYFRWYKSMYTEKILDRNSTIKLITPQFEKYGYGWYIDIRNGRWVAYHDGYLDGFYSYIEFWPDEHMIIAVFGNLDTSPIPKIAHGLSSIMMDWPYDFPIEKEPIDIDADIYHDYVGVYEVVPEEYRWVNVENDSLYTHLWGELSSRLEPAGLDTFFFSLDNTKFMTFVRDSLGKIIGHVVEDTRQFTPAIKLTGKDAEKLMINRTVVRLDPRTLQKYEGIYQVVTDHPDNALRTDVLIAYIDNSLLAAIAGNDPIKFFPNSQTEFFHQENDYLLTFDLDENKEVIGCRVNMMFRDIYFRKIE